MRVLGIETSCDDTGIAVVEDGYRVLGDAVSSQEEHAAYGGIVPEIAARKHVENLPIVLGVALDRAGIMLADVDGIGITRGPGLIGALLSGWCFGRGLARALGVAHVGVHHLAAHVHGALMPRLESGDRIVFPILALVVSGGHTALYQLPAADRFRRIGETRDDAAGEAFDKVAVLLGLGYPGGPVIDRLAGRGDARAVPLPRADLGGALEYSFSGLKTAVRRYAIDAGLEPGTPDDPRVLDLVASFQAAAVDMLVDTVAHALDQLAARALVVAGGVAANSALRARVAELAAQRGVDLYLSPPALSTDNGAMIGGAAYARLAAGEDERSESSARASWPLG